MALSFVAASRQYLSQSTALVSAVPGTFAVWYNPTNNTGEQSLFTVGSTSVTSFFVSEVNSGTPRALKTQSGVGSIVATGGAITAGVWNHIVVVFTSTTSITVYVNGVATTGTGSNTPGSLNATDLGALNHDGTIINFANGAIAYPAAWKGYAATPTDVSTLYNGGAGFNPKNLSNPCNASFSELQGGAPFPDILSGNNWTVNGSPTVVADPFSLSPDTPTVTAQAATVTLNGTITNENGGGNATVWGFVYGMTTTYGSVVQTTGSFSTGAFSLPVTGLAGGITYHFKAFATNSAGSSFSGDTTFTTGTQTKTGTGEILYDGANKLFGGTITVGTLANLFDANALTVAATGTDSNWAGIDCGAPAPLTRLRFTAYPGYEDLVIGGTINGDLADPTFAFPTVLYTFPASGGSNGSGRPLPGLLTNEVLLTGVTAAEFYNFQASASNVFGMADLDFIGGWASGVYSQPVAPVITPPGGNFDQPTVFRMSSITTSASIYYTLDGSAPTTASNLYSGPFVLSSNTQINAIAIDPGLSTPSSRITTSFFFCPSIFYSKQFVYDNRNVQLQGIGGCIFQDPVSGWWYDYGQNQVWNVGQGTAGQTGYDVYRSADLRNWTYMGNICGPDPGLQKAYIARFMVRFQVLYCAATQMYVAWGTEEGHASLGINVYTSPYPDARQPWTYLKTYTHSSPMADGFTGGGATFYGDMGSFVDPSSGLAYLIYNYSSNTRTAFSQLDPSSLTNTLSTNNASYASTREGHTVCYSNGTYFWLSSAETGEQYNLNTYATSSSPVGPWTGATNPFVNVSGAPPNTLAYNGQSDQIIFLPGRGPVWFGDDDDSPDGVFRGNLSTRIIIPIVFPTSSTMTITWQNSQTWFNGATGSGPFPGVQYTPWQLDTVYPTISGAPLAATGLVVTLGLLATWTNNEPNPAFIYLDNSNSATFASGIVSEVLPVGATSFQVTAQSLAFFRLRTVNVNGTTNSKIVPIGLPKDPNALTPVTVSATGIYVVLSIESTYLVENLIAGVDYSNSIQTVISGSYANVGQAEQAEWALLDPGAPLAHPLPIPPPSPWA
jgi:hypothetical protein